MVTKVPRKREGASSAISRGRTIKNQRLDVAHGIRTEGSHTSGNADTEPKDNTSDDDLGDRERGTNDNGSHNEEEVPDSQDPFSSNAIGQGTPSKGANKSANRCTGRDPPGHEAGSQFD